MPGLGILVPFLSCPKKEFTLSGIKELSDAVLQRIQQDVVSVSWDRKRNELTWKLRLTIGKCQHPPKPKL